MLSIQKKEIVLVLAAVGLLLLPLFLHQGMSLQQPPVQSNASKKPAVTKEYVLQNDPWVKQKIYSGIVNPSFEMRENVDFILTPALLVQESISEGCILTYPEE